MSPYLRTVKTTSGATAVQILRSSGARGISNTSGRLVTWWSWRPPRRPACAATIYPKIGEYGHHRPGGRLARLRFGQVRS